MKKLMFGLLALILAGAAQAEIELKDGSMEKKGSLPKPPGYYFSNGSSAIYWLMGAVSQPITC